jgi:hypothetical protein
MLASRALGQILYGVINPAGAQFLELVLNLLVMMTLILHQMRHGTRILIGAVDVVFPRLNDVGFGDVCDKCQSHSMDTQL